jgi:hypothetical protein
MAFLCWCSHFDNIDVLFSVWHKMGYTAEKLLLFLHTESNGHSKWLRKFQYLSTQWNVRPGFITITRLPHDSATMDQDDDRISVSQLEGNHHPIPDRIASEINVSSTSGTHEQFVVQNSVLWIVRFRKLVTQLLAMFLFLLFVTKVLV